MRKLIGVVIVLVAFSAYAATSPYESNGQRLAEDYPEQYSSWHESLKSSEEPALDAPANPAQMIIYGSYYNYRDVVYGKRAHANSMLEAYGSIDGDASYFQRCLPCHSSDAPRLMNQYGEDDYYQGKKFNPVVEGTNPVGCANCHDTETMELRIGNPFAERAVSKIGKDPKKLSQNELRSYVCAQCHFEYDSPVKNGVKTIEMDWDLYGNLANLSDFYDNKAEVSYTHPLSQAPLVKPMNNEAGLAMNGTHYRHGVACADCHMPTVTKGGETYTNHNNVAASRDIVSACQPCHENLTVAQLQQEIDIRMNEYGGKNVRYLENLLASNHLLIKTAIDSGAKADQLKSIYQKMRMAQWRWDYLLWQKGGAFHAPYETQKLLADALVYASDAQKDTYSLLFTLGAKKVEIADFSTVEKAAALLGLDYPQPARVPQDNTWLKGPLSESYNKGSMNKDIYQHELIKLNLK